MGLGADDPALAVADNLKKAAHTIYTPADRISDDELQKLGKMTARNADAIAAVTGQPVDPTTRAQAVDLKEAISADGSIVRDNATPAERAADIAAFQKKNEQIAIDAARAADIAANRRMEKLAAEARHANDVLEAVRQTGDADRIARAKANVENANRAVIEYAETRAAAQKAAVLNDSDAAKIVNEARGIANEGKSPSQIREAAVAGDRKTLTTAAAEPTKPPGVSEGATGEAAAGLKSTILKGAGLGLGIWSVYEGVKRGAEEAGKEADEKGDGSLASTVRTSLYSAWYGLGIGSAKETGERAGKQSNEQWAQDVREGRVDPDSRLSQWYAKIRGVGWGVAEFTGLQAIKDATVESAGYVADRYGQYKSEKIEAEAKAAARPARPGAGDPTQAAAIAGNQTQPGTDQSKPVIDAAKPAGSGPATGAADDRAKAATKPSRGAYRPGYRRRRPPAGRGGAQDGDATQPQSQPTVAPPQTAALPAPQPAPAPQPEPTTVEVEGGWLESASGRTRLIYINDRNGNRIGGYYVHYDRTGKEIGRQSFTANPSAAAAQPAPQTSGAYSGRVSGHASGNIQLAVSGNAVSGRISGSYDGDGFSATFSGGLKPDGSFNVPMSGMVHSKKSYSFAGTINGRLDGRSGAGRWSAKAGYGITRGAWQASR